MKDYYEILEVSRKASKETINKVFRMHMKECHPDLFQGEEKVKAEEKAKEYTEAYNTLSNDEERAKYDLELSQNEDESPKIQTLIQENEYLKEVIAKKDDVIKRLTTMNNTPQNPYSQDVYGQYNNNSSYTQYNNGYGQNTGYTNSYNAAQNNPYANMSLDELRKLKRQANKEYFTNIAKDYLVKLLILALIVIAMLISVSRTASSLFGE